MSVAWSPLCCRILFVMPSENHGRRLIIAFTWSRIGVLLSSGSGMGKSEGCSLLKVYVTLSASASFQGERRWFLRLWPSGICVGSTRPALYTYLWFPLYFFFCPHHWLSFVSGDVGAHCENSWGEADVSLRLSRHNFQTVLKEVVKGEVKKTTFYPIFAPN